MAAIGFTQTGRALKIDTPLGPDVLLLRSLSGQEAVSQLFRFQLELLSEQDDAISFDAIVGQNVTIELETSDSHRVFNGFISRFSQGSRDERFTYYRAELVPWLWFLTRTADCRIFQNKTAPDIIVKIFQDLGFSDYTLRLHGNFRKREYSVQYRETDFNFVSRLMEEEGICYFFEHDAEAKKHTLVLANDAASHKPCPSQAKARCDFASGGWRGEDLISEWRVEQEYRPTAWAHTDYNFETPSTSLMVTVKDNGKYEIYDYPGFYMKKNDGDQLAKTRLQETLAFKSRVSGKSNCRNFTAGATVEVTDHYRQDMNQKWMLTAVYHQSTIGEAYGSGGADEGFFYTNTFECVPADVVFRPPRVTPKPNVQGCQTAVTVGPAGEEIYTDKYGRVKVQFHWDREGKKNEDSSCWVRVSHPWAGKSWGGIYIPRIGDEVIVDFLEGDPDQPIITGRVYHAENMPPWGLPDKKVISGFKTYSTKGGGGYNELSMDDTKGNELVHIHAQFDQDIKVEHDERTNVGRNRTESVGNNETITIGNNRTEQVGVNENITIGANRTENVGANESITVALMRTRNVGVNEMVNIGGAQEITIGGLQAITIGGAQVFSVGATRKVNVAGDQSASISGKLKEDVGSDHSNSVGGKRETSIGSDDKLDVGATLKITAANEIVLETGASKVSMKSDGTIEITGMNITINGSAALKGQSAMINMEASGVNTIKGSLVKIN